MEWRWTKALPASWRSRSLANRKGGSNRNTGLPIRGRVVFQDLAPDMRAGIDAVEDRIHDARATVDDVERRVKALLGGLARGNLHRILVGDPAGVDAVHVDAVGMVIGCRRARHHVQRRL